MDENAGRLLEELYERHASAVLAYALRRVDDAAAEEIVADTFVVAWRRLQVVPEPALPWLYGVARRLIANQLRATSRRRALLERIAASIQATDVESPGPQALEAIARLRCSDREALLLVAWEGLSTAEVAVALGCSPAAARARLHRARRRLRAELSDQQLARSAPRSAMPTMEGKTP